LTSREGPRSWRGFACLRATFVTVGRLDYYGTVSQIVENHNRRVRLLLDELGYLPIDKRGADLLFQVVAAHDEVGSIVITTNRPFREYCRTPWG